MNVRETVVTVGALRFPMREAGPADGVPVILLHGFPDCFYSYDAQLAALAAAGYRAIAPALRGYSPGAIPADRDYHLTTLAGDLCALLDALEIPRAHLVGHDWGAAIGWLAVAEQPQRFLSFSSLAIPPLGGLLRAARRYPGQLRNSWYMFFFQWRGIADLVLARNDFAFVDKLWRDWSPGWQWPAENMARVKETFRQPGVAQAALGYYRALFGVLAAPNRRAQMLIRQPVQVPVLVLQGRNDGCMDARLPAASVNPKQFTAGVRLVTVENAGHFLHQEQPAEVNRLLLDFLAGHATAPALR
ncbi:MAG: alpha/beta fold hydrolase [Pseudomonadota bacterium]